MFKVIGSFNNADNNSNDLNTPLHPLTTDLTTGQNGTLVSAGENHTILDMFFSTRKQILLGCFFISVCPQIHCFSPVSFHPYHSHLVSGQANIHL